MERPGEEQTGCSVTLEAPSEPSRMSKLSSLTSPSFSKSKASPLMQLPVTYNIFVLSNETKLIDNRHNYSQKIVRLSHHNPSPPRILALAEYSKFRLAFLLKNNNSTQLIEGLDKRPK
jgi:hypothetical protein